jgi:C4-dicarboxylate-specific signal transduction histidine kinase
VLALNSKRPRVYKKYTREASTMLASQAGAAVQRALLFDNMNRAFNDLREAQQELLQSGKLCAVGELLSGVAHELKNSFTAMQGFSDLLRCEVSDPEEKECLERIISEIQRSSTIVDGLLRFARRTEDTTTEVDVNLAILKTLDLVEHMLNAEHVNVEKDLCSFPAVVYADFYQLQQVFLNIVNNARHAMSEIYGQSQLLIKTEVFDGALIATFEDSGPGIPNLVLPHVFESFFTTKPEGEGTGLGLSLSSRIISQWGGRIEATNSSSGGAVLKVVLPLAESQSQDVEAVRSA